MDEEQRDEFMDGLYGTGGEDAAKQNLREHLAAQGIEWDGEI